MAADVVHAARVGEVEKLASEQRLHLERNRKQILTLHTVYRTSKAKSGSKAFSVSCRCVGVHIELKYE